MRRADKSEQTMTDFLSMPSLSYCFDQMALEILTAPPKLTNLVDLHLDLT